MTSQPEGPRAFDARELARALSEDRDLMDRFKQAAADGTVHAVSTSDGNRTVVEDPELVAAILAGPGRIHHYDPPSE